MLQAMESGQADFRTRANEMKKVDTVIVGFGWAGAIMAKELTEAGLNVVALECGPHRDTYLDGSYQ